MEVEIMKRRSGFTLIEMMIVLAIIAALSATLVPIAMNALNQAKVTGNLTDVESIRLAEMQYFYKKDTTTDSWTDLEIYLEKGNLQGANRATYNLIATPNSSDTITVYVNFEDEQLAKAFEAQFPTEMPNVDFTRHASATVLLGNASITYTFK
jgi:prepilin-type N-terminal cleavage/methylation domain-containing protein